MGPFEDGCARFQIWNANDPAALQGQLTMAKCVTGHGGWVGMASKVLISSNRCRHPR